MLLFETEAKPRLSILPRDYQNEAVECAIRLWDAGTQGALVRAFTGAGKTIIAAMLIDLWLARGEDYRAMVLSYEQQLVDQFAEEIHDVLGIQPGIEMEKRVWQGQQICVASRQSLLPKSLVDEGMKAQLASHGLSDFDLLTASLAKQLLRGLSKGEIDAGDAQAMIGEHNCHWMTHAERKIVSRVHRFDWRYNWMIVADEAHKFPYRLKSIGHIHDWFSQNVTSRWLGITATPKRSDGVSIGHKMFPGVALDFPLYSPRGRCAIREGYAVPYRQKYICVEGVDFKSLKKVSGDFDENELERVLGTEEQLAKLVEPLLDLCETRKTLIFSPTVEMAKNVSAYINARAKCQCECGAVKWHPSLLIGDGAKCPQCESLMDVGNAIQRGDQCHVLHESIPTQQRKEIYHGHQSGKFQFLSVCGLCIARGTLVLTDHGEIPIERVTLDMKLWDGVEFVSHDGVISKGRKEVILYAGLTATGDHNVWTENGWERLAACKQQRIAVRVSAISGTPVRESCGYYRNDHSTWQEPPRGTGSAVQWLRESLCQVLQRIEVGSRWLQAMRETLRRSTVVANALQRCEETLRKSTRQVLSRLWREGNQVPVFIASGDGAVDYGELGPSQRIESRPQREQWSLRAWKHSLVEPERTGEQQTATAEVFDILNSGPRNRFTANGLIVSNCKEGYNDPDIACVAVFRPVSKAASSLAEQMKGRGSRPLRGLINGIGTAGERREIIERSAKPDCLIVDLVGITGLADCASTALIYAEGLPDEVKQVAEEILVSGEIEDVEEAIEEAQQRVEADKERIRQERLEMERRAKEEAQRRAKAQAEVEYSTHDVGTGSAVDPTRCTDKQLGFIRFLGMEFIGWEPTKKQAMRIIGQLQSGLSPDEIAYTNGIPADSWKQSLASSKQIWKLRQVGYRGNSSSLTPQQASGEIERRVNPANFYGEKIGKAADDEHLTTLAKEVFHLRQERRLSDDQYAALVAQGQRKRNSFRNQSEDF